VKAHLIWAAVAVVLLGGWLRSHDAGVRALALAQEHAKALESRLDSSQRLVTHLGEARAQLAARVRLDSLGALRDRAVHDSLRRVASAGTHLVDSLLVSLPDTAPVHRALVAERAAGAACEVAISSCERERATLRASLANADSARAVLEPLVPQLRSAWQAAERRARPHVRFGLCVGAGMTVGLDGVWRPAPFGGLCLSR
jgi:hypothetical protein